MSLLADILSSQIRAEIFRLMFDRRKISLHLREIQRRSGLTIGTVQKEVKRLSELALVIPERDGNRLYFSANETHPLYKEICGLVEKTSGAARLIQEALEPLPGIECAFLFGSFARGEEKAQSDIDLLVIGEIGLRALTAKLSFVTPRVEREINPHVYGRKAWRERLRKKDHFLRNVLAGKKIFLIGGEDELG